MTEGATSEQQSIAAVANGSLSVTWAGAQQQISKRLLPVKIPILKGLLGHRIFIIREERQSLFDNVTSIDSLKRLTAGQARYDSDTDILKAANLNVVDPVKHSSLFPMLEGGRFDYLPRAVTDPWEDVKQYKDMPLTVEKGLMLIYPYAINFYVSKNNPTLHQAIESGFYAAIEDGSFDTLFFNHELIKTVFNRSNFRARKVFHIQNPEISASAYQQDSKLWLNVENL